MGTTVGLAPSTLMLSWVGVTIQSYSRKGATQEGHSAADYRRLWGVILLTVVSSVLLGWRVKAVIKAQAREAERSGLVIGTAGGGRDAGQGAGDDGAQAADGVEDGRERRCAVAGEQRREAPGRRGGVAKVRIEQTA